LVCINPPLGLKSSHLLSTPNTTGPMSALFGFIFFHGVDDALNGVNRYRILLHHIKNSLKRPAFVGGANGGGDVHVC
jgi:hypothetical protein